MSSFIVILSSARLNLNAMIHILNKQLYMEKGQKKKRKRKRSKELRKLILELKNPLQIELIWPDFSVNYCWSIDLFKYFINKLTAFGDLNRLVDQIIIDWLCLKKVILVVPLKHANTLNPLLIIIMRSDRWLKQSNNRDLETFISK